MKSNEVYKITNKITGKIYIGITNQGSGARYRHHWYESRIGEPSPIHRSMAKYGEDNFTLEIIDFAETYEELKEKEKFWIKKFNSTDRNIGYNLTEGGDGTFGRVHSEETKEKIRQKALGRKISEETKKKMSEARIGNNLSSQSTKQIYFPPACLTPFLRAHVTPIFSWRITFIRRSNEALSLRIRKELSTEPSSTKIASNEEKLWHRILSIHTDMCISPL